MLRPKAQLRDRGSIWKARSGEEKKRAHPATVSQAVEMLRKEWQLHRQVRQASSSTESQEGKKKIMSDGWEKKWECVPGRRNM
jgi:hypothetical protein